MTFEEWKDDYGLVYEPNYSEATEADCKAAFAAGAASRDAEIAELVAAVGVWLDIHTSEAHGRVYEAHKALAKVRKP